MIVSGDPHQYILSGDTAVPHKYGGFETKAYETDCSSSTSENQDQVCVQCSMCTVCNLPIRGDSDEGVGEDCRCEYRHVAAPCLLSPAPGLLITYSVQSPMYSMDSGNPLQSLIAQKASEKFLILLSFSQRSACGCCRITHHGK